MHFLVVVVILYIWSFQTCVCALQRGIHPPSPPLATLYSRIYTPVGFLHNLKFLSVSEHGLSFPESGSQFRLVSLSSHSSSLGDALVLPLHQFSPEIAYLKIGCLILTDSSETPVASPESFLGRALIDPLAVSHRPILLVQDSASIKALYDAISSGPSRETYVDLHIRSFGYGSRQRCLDHYGCAMVGDASVQITYPFAPHALKVTIDSTSEIPWAAPGARSVMPAVASALRVALQGDTNVSFVTSADPNIQSSILDYVVDPLLKLNDSEYRNLTTRIHSTFSGYCPESSNPSSSNVDPLPAYIYESLRAQAVNGSVLLFASCSSQYAVSTYSEYNGARLLMQLPLPAAIVWLLLSCLICAALSYTAFRVSKLLEISTPSVATDAGAPETELAEMGEGTAEQLAEPAEASDETAEMHT
jgi:hypothetical protein